MMRVRIDVAGRIGDARLGRLAELLSRCETPTQAQPARLLVRHESPTSYALTRSERRE